ncbi:MAG: DedA family protein [Planctomycetota bacterium]
MFEWLVETFTMYPYWGVAAVFFLCSVGFPLPEEIVLVSAGYVCFKDLAELVPMMLACSAAILTGDLLPFWLGRTFGSRLLRVRALRVLVNRRRLSQFDTWFRRRGDLVIFFARFVTGLRVVAYFTAGVMRMSYPRFIVLDLLGICLVVPIFTYVGYRFGSIIDDAILRVQQVERGILIAVAIAAGLVLLFYWLRRHGRGQTATPKGTYVGPSIPRTDAAPDQGDVGAEVAEAPNNATAGPGADPAAEQAPEEGAADGPGDDDPRGQAPRPP